MCKRAAAAKPTKPVKPAAAVSNPLKDKERIRAAAVAAARELVAEEARFTGAQFSRKVLEKMGCGREFAVNDQGTRTRLHSKDVKLAAFEAVGVGGAWRLLAVPTDAHLMHTHGHIRYMRRVTSDKHACTHRVHMHGQIAPMT